MASHPRRLENFRYIGKHRYFLTFSTYMRRRVFHEETHVAPVATQLLRSSEEHAIAIHTYCLMPDHGHLLAEGLTIDSNLRAFMSEFKQRTAWHFRQRTGERLWQGSFFDHVLRPEEGIDAAIAYIINNPVRAGLARTPAEYPFWDSFTQSREGLLEFVHGAGVWQPGRSALKG
jgi:REP element-mobilizing transposase RayT